MKFSYLLFLVLLFIVSPLLAQSEENESLPINLKADSGEYDQKSGVAVYQGNVEIIQGTTKISADKLTVYLKNNVVDHLIAVGSPVNFDYRGEEKPIKGYGEKLEYFVSEKKIVLTGNALIEQDQDQVRGDMLSYNLDKETIEAKGVNMVLQPAE